MRPDWQRRPPVYASMKYPLHKKVEVTFKLMFLYKISRTRVYTSSAVADLPTTTPVELSDEDFYRHLKWKPRPNI